MNLEIYTDGGKFPAENWAAWGFVVPVDPSGIKSPFSWKTEIEEGVTSNGAEVLAAAKALEWVAESQNLARSQQIEIVTDSSKVFVGLTGQIEVWAARGWKKKNRVQKVHSDTQRGLSEKDLWVYLYAQKLRLESMGFTITATHVPSHAGIYWNEVVDTYVSHCLRSHGNSLSRSNPRVQFDVQKWSSRA